MNANTDQLRESIAGWARLGRQLPPSWEGVKHSIPVSSPEAVRLGSLLPGMGLYLDCDLKSLGIRKRIPHVFERTETCKATEALGRERLAVRLIAMRDYALRGGHIAGDLARAAITTYDGIISARAGGSANDIVVSKASITSVANTWYSLMLAGAGTVAALSGLAAGSGSLGAGGTVCTRATTGAWSLGLSNPTTGQTKYLLTFGYTAAQQLQMLMLIDLLVGVSGLSTNSATNNVNSVALTRYTSGAGVWPVMECTTAPTAGAFNWGGTYTNQSGTGSQAFTATAAVSAQVVNRVQPNATGIPFCPSLAAGDYGVQSVQTVTTSAQVTTGVFSLYLVYPISMIPGIGASVYSERDSTIQIDGLTALAADGSNVLGCLGGLVVPNTTSTGVVIMFLRTCAG